jgi:hypothetical protein
MMIVLLDAAQRRFEAEDAWWREKRRAKELFIEEFARARSGRSMARGLIGWHLASCVCLGTVAACSSDHSGGPSTAARSGDTTGATSGSAGGGSGSTASGAAQSGAAGTDAASTGTVGGSAGAASGGAGTGAMGGSGTATGDDGGMSSDAAPADGGAGTDSPGGMGQFTITFDASAPNHFGPEHAGLTAYAELVDTTGGTKKRVGDIYSSPMTATGYAKWVWKNVGVAGHTYTFAIFDDAATMNPTCKGGMPPAGDAGWTFPVNGGMPLTTDYSFIFPTGRATRDPNTCAWFPTGPITGTVFVPTP